MIRITGIVKLEPVNFGGHSVLAEWFGYTKHLYRWIDHDKDG